MLDEKGIINVGGKKRDIFDFAKKFSDSKILPINLKKIKKFPKNSSININRFKKILKKKGVFKSIKF